MVARLRPQPETNCSGRDNVRGYALMVQAGPVDVQPSGRVQILDWPLIRTRKCDQRGVGRDN